MTNKGSALIIIAITVVVLLMVGGALIATRSSPATAGTAGPATGPTFAVTYARAAGGLNATLTMTNRSTSELKDVRIVVAAIKGMTMAGPVPLMIGAIPAGGSKVVAIPYTGTRPPANAPVQIELQYDYDEGWFTRGAGSTSLTTVVP